jgi:hypothetical protein
MRPGLTDALVFEDAPAVSRTLLPSRRRAEFLADGAAPCATARVLLPSRRRLFAARGACACTAFARFTAESIFRPVVLRQDAGDVAVTGECGAR